jgi:hypothetical protein
MSKKSVRLDKVDIINGMLIPDDRVKYNNTPIIMIDNIKGIQWYSDDGYYITFSEDLKWHFNSEKKCVETFNEIIMLIAEGNVSNLKLSEN